ncbi:hypothetical protein Tco_1510823 [Tanacetum coccineum]
MSASALKFKTPHRGDLNQLRSQDRAVNQNRSRESQENVDSRLQSFEQIMEIGHKERGPSELTFEQLEHKFQDKIKRLITRHGHLEDEEIARHKERMIEINTHEVPYSNEKMIENQGSFARGSPSAMNKVRESMPSKRPMPSSNVFTFEISTF